MFPKPLDGMGVVSFSEAVARVKAATEARNEIGLAKNGPVIIARTELS